VTADLLGRLSLLRLLPDASAILRRNRCHERLLTHLAAGRTDRAIGAVKELHATTSRPAVVADPDRAGPAG
jgi:hypothetical protein